MSERFVRREYTSQPIPAVAGIGLRSPHVRELLISRPRVAWLEVHSENYFSAGGPHIDALERLRQDYDFSLHGVGLSLGSADGIDINHLERLQRLADKLQPGLVSEHLSWSAVDGYHLNDLLPVPHTSEALAHFVSAISKVQDVLQRQILIENISSYVDFPESEMTESQFLVELARRSGCGILLDINNVYVNTTNRGLDPFQWLEAIPGDLVHEIHLAGHSTQCFDSGELLVDTHSTRVSAPVWCLFESTLRRIGARPTLIEWDTELPELEVLLGEADIARSFLNETANELAA